MARATGHGKPLPNAALSSNITREKEQTDARALGERVRKVHEGEELVAKNETMHKGTCASNRPALLRLH